MQYQMEAKSLAVNVDIDSLVRAGELFPKPNGWYVIAHAGVIDKIRAAIVEIDMTLGRVRIAT